MDLKLDTNGDLDITDSELSLTSGAEAVIQDLQIRLSFFLGEWFLDTRQGIPYYQQILGKKPRLNVIRAIFRKAIMTTTYVNQIEELTLDYDGATRLLVVDFAVATDFGIVSLRKELII